jgi:predicted ATP-grasp superfamily ATP-dependent carboligase
MKPVAAHHWRKAGNWQLVGGRKAIGVSSQAELLAEYKAVARAEQRVLVQEMIDGADDCLVIAACYFDRQSNFVAGFNTHKLIQIPEGFGTGCILEAVDRPELFERTVRLLQEIRYTGIAEVEYKWDAARNDYQLIEINPRPWDQHRLGWSCGVELMYQAYCEHAGLAMPPAKYRAGPWKWMAEDIFVLTALQMLWRRDPALPQLLRMARGKRTYSIWSWRDPLPFVVYVTTVFLPRLIASGLRNLWISAKNRISGKRNREDGDLVYERQLENENSHR